ncbi:secretin N-terminal domain-containing protein [Oleiharenicola sp. Vm1]|uniref:secretin N-terminal domain-containing protein n=1 Tax=Oleiharenicola sp. Vm1 TaxID=3398393 RepID=UPI0039F5D9A3
MTPRKIVVLAAVLFAGVFAQADTSEIEASLDQVVPRFSTETPQPLRQVLDGIGKAYTLPIVVQPGVDGDVSLNVNNTTLRGLLTMLCKPRGYFWEINDDGFIYVRRTKTVLYAVDYPQNTRGSNENSSVTLGGTGTGVSSNGNNLGGTVVSSPTTGQNGQYGSGGSGDNTQVSLTGENRVDFWEKLEGQIKAMLGKEETVIMNRFAGLVEVDASDYSHARVSAFLSRFHRRVGRQIVLEAKILEVTLRDQNKLGVDWNVAAFRIGDAVRVGGAITQPGTTNVVSGLTGTTLAGITAVGDQSLSGDTFAGTIGVGKVNALVQALKEQGDVRSTSAPRISALNNQTAFIKVADTRTFYSRSNTTTINTGQVTSTQAITTTNYTAQSTSIGTFLRIVAQSTDDTKPEDATITLDVAPMLTRQRGVDTSPDGQSTAPILAVQQASTIVRVRSGESAVIGGMQTHTVSKSQRAIPGLSSIPVVGKAFQTNGDVEQLTELVIIITATIVEPGMSKPVDIEELMSVNLKSKQVQMTPPAAGESPKAPLKSSAAEPQNKQTPPKVQAVALPES